MTGSVARSGDSRQPAEREREEIERLRALAVAGAGALRTAAHWEQFLHRAERTLELGFVNTMLVWEQRPDFVQLRDYQGWKRAGRQVLRDEQGIQVILPSRRKSRDAAGTGERIGVLFDLMQTEGRAVPVRVPGVRLEGSLRPEAWCELATLGLRERVPVPGTTAATATVTSDWIEWFTRASGEDAAMREALVLVRNIAARLLSVRPAGTPESRLLRTVQVDSVAILMALRLGLDTSGFTFPGVGSWAGADERAQPDSLVAAVGARIMSVAQPAFACFGTSHSGAIRLVTGPRLARNNAPSDAANRVAPASAAAAAADSRAARIQEAAAGFFAERVPGSWVPVYLTGRGFSDAVQRHWGIGYAPRSWNALTQHLQILGYSEATIEASGLAKRSSRGTLIDVFRDRAMFPVRAPDSTLLGFIGRAPADAGKGIPKYLNTRGTVLYQKGKVLFGLHEGGDQLAAGASPVVVEGPLDAIAVTSACGGRYVGAAPCGTALTADQVGQLLTRVAGDNGRVLVAFDGDQAGQRAASRAWDLLGARFAEPLSVSFPAGEDPASVLAGQGGEALVQMLDERAHPLADVVVDAAIARYGPWLEFIEGKFNALNAVAPQLAQLPTSQVARQVGRVAEQLSLAHAEVTSAVTEAADHIEFGTGLPADTCLERQNRKAVSPPQATSGRPAHRRTATESRPGAARRAG